MVKVRASHTTLGGRGQLVRASALQALQFKRSIQLAKTLHAFFFISILFISIIRLRSGKNKHNLSITKAQILPHDELKIEENQS